MTARLHVLLGPGGVGKTTLAAGYALALAAQGRRVGLLGIDPSRRLQDTLGVALADADAPILGAGALRAAIVQPHQAIERWVAEACSDSAARALRGNPFFAALGDRLATATDVLAAARVAEWAERDPALDDLVVDTAPGISAIEFLRSPRQIEALVRGRLVRWLRDARLRGLRAGARRVLGGFASLAGARMVGDFVEFFALVGRPFDPHSATLRVAARPGGAGPFDRMLARVERTHAWLGSRDAELLLVTSPRDTAAAGAAQLVAALAREGLAPRAVIVNRTHPAELAGELAGVTATPVVAYARAVLAAQARVLAEVAAWPTPSVVLPSLSLARRSALVELGAALARELGREPVAARRAS